MDFRQIHSAILDIDCEISSVYAQLAVGRFEECEENQLYDKIEELLDEKESLSSLLPDDWEVLYDPPCSI